MSTDLKTSAEWIKEYHYDITNPTGWDKTDFTLAFNYECISQSEFEKRLRNSETKKRQKTTAFRLL